MPFGLYLHLPFCVSKCPYCNFSSITNAEGLIESYINALLIEMGRRQIKPFLGSPRTIYIGGGTPSIVPAKYIQKLVKKLYPDPKVEFTVEANPESISVSWLDGILDSGANRLSIGIQSLDNRMLHNLGRIHRADEAISSVEIARKAGFSNISVDLMFGVPGQTKAIWEKTLKAILEIKPDHISCYCLGVEEDTKYYEMSKKDKIEIPDSEKTAEMYMLMVEILEENGYKRYEISNFALKGKECKHNLSYWNFTPYIGAGVSAHSFDGKMRYWNEKDPEIYLQKIMNKQVPVADYELIDENKRIMEVIMLSLRTTKGINLEELAKNTSGCGNLLDNRITSYVESGLMEYIENGNLILTVRGACIANEIITDIFADFL